MQDVNKVDKPKFSGPKPTIPSKPRYVPPVNLKTQKLQTQTVISGIQRLPNPTNVPDVGKPPIKTTSQETFYSTYKESFLVQENVPTSNPNIMTYTRCDDFSSYKEKSTSLSESTKVIKEEHKQKAPSSPSTVCCSILPNAAGDCCGTLNLNKKEVKCGELMTKVDSLDSNSSDSGGFKDFVQPSFPSIALTPDVRRCDLRATHERKASQPEILEKKITERRNQTHQRQTSQPDLTYHEPRQSCAQNKPTVVPSAQALALFLPSADQKLMRGFSFQEPDSTSVTRRLSQSFLYPDRKTNEKTQPLTKPHITAHVNFQQSSKKLEELFSQRLERDKALKKGGTCLVENENKRDIEEKLQVQKQFQQKLQADIQQTVKHIQEIQNTELRLPQNRKWSESNRSQPAIGLKHTPKSRPTIFGTVASDHTLKDCSGSRRCLPQTPHTKSFSSNYNGDGAPENGDDSSIQQEHTLVYRDGNLLSGSLDALIQHMVPTDTYYPDRAYIFAFLLSSRLFIKPHDLLAKIRNFYEIQQGLNNSMGAGNPGRTRFAEHLVDLLAEWTETFPYDFRDERVMQHVQTMTQQCCILNPSLRTNVSSILHNLLQRLTSLETYEKSLEKSQVPLEDFTDDITEICPFPSTLAQQLTQLELERLSFIGPEEFVQAFAKENPLLETSFKDMKKTRNLEQYVQWFNRLSYFVATQVCKYQKKKQRVRMMEYWIETGRECFNIGNFNSLMAIISGLNMSPISRLKKTWNKIHSGKFAILEHQMDPSSNFSSYRSTLKAAMWRSAGATDQRQRIVIPFFSLLVKDLYFLNQGCSNRLPNGHINFEKFWQLAKQVTEFMAWKQVACPFERDVRILSLLQHGTILNENSLALASFDCEPPENNQEKERCKSLKADSTTTL